MKLVTEKLDAGAELTRHWHGKPYVTLVMRGDYIEAGDQGRFRVGPGDVLVHSQFASHANWIASRRDVATLNIELEDMPAAPAICTSPNFDKVARLATSDLPSAIDELFAALAPKVQASADWPELLAKAIRDNPQMPVGHWCRWLDLAPGTVSRGFKRAFGVSAAQYRATARARSAYHELTHSHLNLAALADLCGFSDQAHLTRSIRTLTGAPPTFWRRVKNLQDNKSSPK